MELHATRVTQQLLQALYFYTEPDMFPHVSHLLEAPT